MREKDLITLMGLLNVPIHDRNGDWLHINCPTAHKTHAGGKDNTPSCGVSVSSDKPSVVHCFTCGTRKLSKVIHILNWTKGINKDVFRFYLEKEVFTESETNDIWLFNDKFSTFKKKEVPEPVPDFILDYFSPIEEAKDYLSGRGISIELAKEYGLKFCKYHKTIDGKIWQNAIVCPVRDTDFKTYWLHFRSVDSKRFWHGKPVNFGLNYDWGRSDSWAGIEFLDVNKPIIMVEGFFDMLRLRTLGISNVIASHGGVGKNSEKVKRILDLHPKLIYTGFDADDAGRTFSKNVSRQAPCEVIDLDWSRLNIKDPGDLKTKADFDTLINPKQEFKFQDKYSRRKLHELV